MTPSGKYGDRWSRDELILALYLYCQIPFAKTKANNPEVIRLARLIGRTPASVARRLGNFGAFDPLLAEQGISGLTHAGKASEQIWGEFHNRWEALIDESARLLVSLVPYGQGSETRVSSASEDEEIFVRPSGPSERRVAVHVRLFQAFFRRAVLASYDAACCVCGLDIRSLLVASHIKAWSVDRAARTDPENGLCLCAIHDRAFDKGLITVSEELRLIAAPRVISSKQIFVRTVLADFHDRPLRMPKRFAPRPEFLDWHRLNIFDRDPPLLPIRLSDRTVVLPRSPEVPKR